MPVRVGFMSSAHMHAWGYAHGVGQCEGAVLAGIWDEDAARAEQFARQFDAHLHSSPELLFEACDAVIVCSENRRHPEHVELAARAEKAILCEKPIVTSYEEWERIRQVVADTGALFMTAFPCRYSPAFRRLQERVAGGEIGKVIGICATNRGRNPGGWFIQPELSGGGAMIDHVVHVADLLFVLLGESPARVQAFSGNRMHGQAWEDTAMLTLEFSDGLFATLDSSWSRPKSYKTWGDVTLNVVGEWGVIEVDLFSQALNHFSDRDGKMGLLGYGSDLDSALVGDFVAAVAAGAASPISAEAGWNATRVALAGYESAKTGQPVDL